MAVFNVTGYLIEERLLDNIPNKFRILKERHRMNRAPSVACRSQQPRTVECCSRQSRSPFSWLQTAAVRRPARQPTALEADA